jgi:glutathione peroxidase-family protein
MKLMTILSIWLTATFSTGIYDLSVVSADGTSVALSRYQGKRLLIVVLPASRQSKDIQELQQLDSISRKYSGQISVIGVPSYENGFIADSLPSLRQFYGSLLGGQVLLTQGMYTNKTSTGRQNALFAWLTDKSRNSHFDEDVKGPGHKFFVNAQGELRAVFAPGIGLTDRLMLHLITP